MADSFKLNETNIDIAIEATDFQAHFFKGAPVIIEDANSAKVFCEHKFKEAAQRDISALKANVIVNSGAVALTGAMEVLRKCYSDDTVSNESAIYKLCSDILFRVKDPDYAEKIFILWAAWTRRIYCVKWSKVKQLKPIYSSVMDIVLESDVFDFETIRLPASSSRTDRGMIRVVQSTYRNLPVQFKNRKEVKLLVDIAQIRAAYSWFNADAKSFAALSRDYFEKGAAAGDAVEGAIHRIYHRFLEIMKVSDAANASKYEKAADASTKTVNSWWPLVDPEAGEGKSVLSALDSRVLGTTSSEPMSTTTFNEPFAVPQQNRKPAKKARISGTAL